MARSDRGPGLQAPGRPQYQRDGERPVNAAVKTSKKGVVYIDYKDTESLRRLMSNNGKVSSRRRTGATAMEQRMVAQAIKRARFMALLPFVETAG